MTVDISNFKACIDETAWALYQRDEGPTLPLDYHALRPRLDAAAQRLPPLYRDAVLRPYLARLDELGPTGFTQVLLRDPKRQGLAGLMLDIAQAILQNGERYEDRATDGFQEVVSDLYDGFLSAEDRRGVKPPDRSTIPPLVKWGNPSFGPYTWPISATANFGLKAAIVNLPPANARAGLLAWPTLPHETGGHDIIHADSGLAEEMAKVVYSALAADSDCRPLADYWASRIDETASDMLGILNAGPYAAAGTILYFRALHVAYSGEDGLSRRGDQRDSHPTEILRGYLAAELVYRNRFKSAEHWGRAIDTLLNDNGGVVVCGNVRVDTTTARRSAAIIAEVLPRTPLQALERHALADIQEWYDDDEEAVAELQQCLRPGHPLNDALAGGYYAAHVVSATIGAALRNGAYLPALFTAMVGLLKEMHDTNPSWGPMYVVHPGDIARHSLGFPGVAPTL